MNIYLILLVIKMIKGQLDAEIARLVLAMPDSYAHYEGDGSLLSPRQKIYPVLDGFYRLSTMIDNIAFELEGLLKPSQK